MSPLKQITTKMSEVANIKKNAVISLSGGMDSTRPSNAFTRQ